jgi:hypothetical protein
MSARGKRASSGREGMSLGYEKESSCSLVRFSRSARLLECEDLESKEDPECKEGPELDGLEADDIVEI